MTDTQDRDSLDDSEASESLLIAVRVEAPEGQASDALAQELFTHLQEMPRGLGLLANRPEQPGIVWLAVTSVRYLPGALSRIVDWKRRREVAISFPDVTVTGIESGPYQAYDPDAGSTAVTAPPLAGLMPQVLALAGRLEVIEEQLIARGTRGTAEDAAVPVRLEEGVLEEVTLSDRQRNVLAGLIEREERLATQFEGLLEETEALRLQHGVDLLRLQANSAELDAMLQDCQARVDEFAAMADELAALGDVKSAVETHQDAIALAEAMVEADPDTPQWQEVLAMQCWKAGMLKGPGNPRSTRRRHLARALQLATALESRGQLTRDELAPRKIRKVLQSIP